MSLEKILDIQIVVYMSLYILVTFLALYRFTNYKKTALRYFPLILIVTLITEYFGLYLGTLLGSNTLLYNIFSFFYFLFIFKVFKEAIQTKIYKKMINVIIVIFLAVFVVSALIKDFYYGNQIETYVIGTILSILCILMYFSEILKSNKIIQIKHDMLFWISIGFFLFFAGTIPIEIMREIFEFKVAIFNSLRAIQYTLIIMMNLCFIVGLLLQKPKL